MAKVTVTICDVCKERIAGETCPTCERDLCKPCTKNLSIELGVRFGPKAEFYKGAMCSDCYKKTERNHKQIIGQLSIELEPNVLKVIKDSLGNPQYSEALPQENEAKIKKELVENTSSDYRGGYEPPAREDMDRGSEITKAELPEGMDVTKDL